MFSIQHQHNKIGDVCNRAFWGIENSELDKKGLAHFKYYTTKFDSGSYVIK